MLIYSCGVSPTTNRTDRSDSEMSRKSSGVIMFLSVYLVHLFMSGCSVKCFVCGYLVYDSVFFFGYLFVASCLVTLFITLCVGALFATSFGYLFVASRLVTLFITLCFVTLLIISWPVAAKRRKLYSWKNPNEKYNYLNINTLL